MALVAFPLLALRWTHDPVLIAGVAVAGRLPALVVGLPAGVIADRVSRRALAVGAECARLAALLAFSLLVVAHAASLVSLYATVLVIGAGDQFYQAAAFASLPTIVSGGLLDRANGRLEGVDIAGEQFLGQGVGGLLLTLGRALPFVTDAVSFLASGLLVARALPAGAVEPAGTGLLEDLRTGLRWFVGHRVLRLLAALIGSFSFCGYMVVGLLVLFAREVLHVSATGYGLLLASLAVGNVVGSLLASRVASRFGAIPIVLLVGGVAGASYAIVGWQRSMWATVVFLLAENVAIPIANVASLSLRQRVIPGKLLGRVGMTFRMVIFGLMPLGALAGGILAHFMTVSDVFVLAGLAQLLALAAIGPLLRRAGAASGTSKPAVTELTDAGRPTADQVAVPAGSGMAAPTRPSTP